MIVISFYLIHITLHNRCQMYYLHSILFYFFDGIKSRNQNKLTLMTQIICANTSDTNYKEVFQIKYHPKMYQFLLLLFVHLYS